MNEGKLCVSVTGETAGQMLEHIERAERLADIIELRLDGMDPAQIAIVRDEISKRKVLVPIIATFRSPEQGGAGSASIDERRAIWRGSSDGYWAADVEEDVFTDAERWPRRILSFHDYTDENPDIVPIAERFVASPADVIKFATATNDITDALPVWKVLEIARSNGKPCVPVGMGDAGKWTRILGPAHGAYMTYAPLEQGLETAPGQISVSDLITTFRVKEIDRNTRVYGIVGDPVSQSFSPYFQNAAFVSTGVNAVFLPLLVKDLGGFMRRMVRIETREVDLNFGGFSVTMPHKQAIMDHLDHLDEAASEIGAVNTVNILNDGKLIGYNTDAHGFITPLKAKFSDVKDARVAVFGAGGAARACVYALKKEGAGVTVFVRDPAKAAAFSDDLAVEVKLIPDGRTGLLVGTDILVDATPIGMKGDLENTTLFLADQLTGVKFVYDLVTKASDTPLMLEAKKAGISVLGGLEMLIAQGMKQFEIWTGCEAPEEVTRAAVLARMHQQM